MKEICVVILTLKNEKLLKKSLIALSESVSFLKGNFIVVVVDNGNSLTGEDLKVGRGLGGKIRLIKNEKNLGFARAVNQGIKAKQAKYYLLLNDDCFVEKKTVERMVDFLEKNKQIFATQAVILKPDGKVENIGFYVDLRLAKAYPITSKKYWREPKMEERYISGLSATCFLVKKELFEKIGYFDESFHSYLEDVDLSIRANRKNLRLYPTLSAKAKHLHLTTSKKMGTYKQRRDFINWLRIIKKHYSLSMVLRYFPFLLVERLRNLSGVIKAYLSAFNKSV